ncbi:shikimate dehydrogenase [Aureimonas sp. AU12]|uniref:shikimate dehydrogenase family protein n=1 Tax=Aureimonas sp. AU12 TaxID=1638161 RepID=UPI00078210B9|nr:ThiF family adenylyltransferase [Aureimonas sp. AU12]
MIRGTTRLIPVFGQPTATVKAPMIYNPWFEAHGIDAVVIPMECGSGDFPNLLRLVFRLGNAGGAIATMPHKVSAAGLVDRLSKRARIAGSVNAVRLAADGALEGDLFDGEGFVAGMVAKGVSPLGRSALVVGAGGVGSAISASLAEAGVARLALYDPDEATRDALAERLVAALPGLVVHAGSRDPSGFDIVVNASPLGMRPSDPLPVDADALSPSTFIGEVVMSREITPFLEEARARGCVFQVGTDMLFEQIPAYLEFFGFGRPSVAELRRAATIRY